MEKLQEIFENDNSIIIYFNQYYDYTYVFHNYHRYNKYFIINQKNNNKKFTSKELLPLNKEFGIEIHFNSTITSLISFFANDIDKNMENLVFIDFTNFNSILVSDIREMVYGCGSLKSIDFSNFNTSKITSMYLMFSECNSLESIDLSNFDISKVTNMILLFYNCSSFKPIDL
jgi:surface protein